MQLMGRHAGFIAANATLARPDGILCLVPEMPFTLDGDGGVIDVLAERLTQRGHAVIVASEGVALGPAAALFVGLAICDFDESLSDADGLGLLREVGLVLFTFTVGLASGPTFLAGLRRGGPIAVAVAAALVVALAGMCALVADVFDLTPADRAGLFAGSATNTPSLQAASEAVTTGDPVVAYSLAYPAPRLPGLGGSHLRCVLAEAPPG